MCISTLEQEFAKDLFKKHYNYDSYNKGFINDWVSSGFGKSKLLPTVKKLVDLGIVKEGSTMFNTRRIKTYTLI